jgi:hypothetical protein
VSVPVEFEPIETWLLDERPELLLEVVRFETDDVVATESGGKVLLESTEASGSDGHIAVLHRRDSIAGIATVADGDRAVRASFQHDSSPRTYSLRKALEPYRLATIEH